MESKFSPRMTECPICKGIHFERDFEKTYHSDTLTWFRCLGCGFTFMNPKLTLNEMRKLYNTAEYWNNASYVNYLDGEAIRVLNSKAKLKRLAPLLPQSGKLLDIGCASGFFTKAASDFGYEVIGIDPAEDMIAYGKKHYGLDLRAKTIEDCDFASESFDLVSLWGTDSHFYDVRRSFNEISHWIRPGGYFMFGYQDYSHWIRKFFPAIKQSINAYYNFSQKSLHLLLDQIGFDMISETTDIQTTSFHRITRTLNFGAKMFEAFDHLTVKVPAISYKVVLAKKKL